MKTDQLRRAARDVQQLRAARTTAKQRARETATFSRFREYRKSRCRGASSGDEVAIE